MTASNNNALHQHTNEVTQTARCLYRPPAAVIIGEAPKPTADKRKRVETDLPTVLQSSPIMPATATATPEVLREIPQIEAAPNVSTLPTDLRHLSNANDACNANDANDTNKASDTSSTSDADDADNTDIASMNTDVVEEVTKSNFFHNNRFSILATNNDSNDNSDNDENNGIGNSNGLYNVKNDNDIKSGDVGNSNTDVSDKEFKCELNCCGRMYN